MLPESHRQAYQEFLRTLLDLQNLSTASNTDAASIQQNFQNVQQIFQKQVAILTSDEVDPAIASRWQSIQTEIYRAIRLLDTDILFLRSSRQAATTEARLKTVSDRTQKLIGYCQALLQEK